MLRNSFAFALHLATESTKRVPVGTRRRSQDAEPEKMQL